MPDDTMNPPSMWERLKRTVVGTPGTMQTREGPVDYRQGGIPGLLSQLKGGNPVTLGTMVATSNPMDEASAIHEGLGHAQGRGALYDIQQQMANPVKGAPQAWKDIAKKYGISEDYFKPSEIYAYTTQPAELSVEDMRQFSKLMQDPGYAEHFNKYKNPKSDWDFNRMQKLTEAANAPSGVTKDPVLMAFIERQKALAAGGR